MIQRAIDTKIAKHREWNRGFLDQTWNPITPPLETSSMAAYLPKVEEYQPPTPPASIRSGSEADISKRAETEDVEMKNSDLPTPVSDADVVARTMFRFASPPPEGPLQSGPGYRRRYGRNGRLFIEERWPKKGAIAKNSGVVYDSDGESGDESVVYPMDYYESPSINHRAYLQCSRVRADQAGEANQKRMSSNGNGNDVVMANGQGTAGQ